VKQIINKYGGKLANEGSVKWLFEKKGLIVLPVKKDSPRDDLELKVIEAGADDLSWYDEEGETYIEIHCAPENLETAKKNLQQQGLDFESASLGWLAKEEVVVATGEMETCQKMLTELDENDAVQNIFSNLKN
jgi:transcriptional/translational regulatory protein YebC/TACO1